MTLRMHHGNTFWCSLGHYYISEENIWLHFRCQQGVVGIEHHHLAVCQGNRLEEDFKGIAYKVGEEYNGSYEHITKASLYDTNNTGQRNFDYRTVVALWIRKIDLFGMEKKDQQTYPDQIVATKQEMNELKSIDDDFFHL